MKPLPVKAVISSIAIALGATTGLSQSGMTVEAHTDPINDSAIDDRSSIDYAYFSSLDQTGYAYSPAYYYADYDIARPEYIL